MDGRLDRKMGEKLDKLQMQQDIAALLAAMQAKNEEAARQQVS